MGASTRASAYFDLARAESFDPTVLNLVEIRPHIVIRTYGSTFYIGIAMVIMVIFSLTLLLLVLLIVISAL